jgi:hypothetical protein
MTLTRAITCNNLTRAENVLELMVSEQPFKYASPPANDPAIGIMGFRAWHQLIFSIRDLLSLLTSDSVLSNVSDEPLRLHKSQHSISPPMTVTLIDFGNQVMSSLVAHRYTTQRQR